MIESPAEILREYGPFPGADHVHGLTFDGRHVWFASGDRLNAFDPESGMIVRTIDADAHAGTAFDGTHLFQLFEKRLQKIDPKTGNKIWSGSFNPPGTPEAKGGRPGKNAPGGKGVFRASPTGADGKIYCVRVTGEVYVLSAGDEFKILSELPLGEGSENVGTVSSVAIAHGNLFVRTPKTLYCFKK